ncbi:MAG TPA: hypothetical protein VMB76_21490 [Casimicrobiaceae bacterium]|nr:hypothetical protein [Casimicrobiaceae bacterium]
MGTSLGGGIVAGALVAGAVASCTGGFASDARCDATLAVDTTSLSDATERAVTGCGTGAVSPGVVVVIAATAAGTAPGESAMLLPRLVTATGASGRRSAVTGTGRSARLGSGASTLPGRRTGPGGRLDVCDSGRAPNVASLSTGTLDAETTVSLAGVDVSDAAIAVAAGGAIGLVGSASTA